MAAAPRTVMTTLVAAATLTGAEVAVGSDATLGGSPVAALLRWDQSAD